MNDVTNQKDKVGKNPTNSGGTLFERSKGLRSNFKLFEKPTKKAGEAPGGLVFTGMKKVDETEISVFDYSESTLNEMKFNSLEGVLPFRDTQSVSWINIRGIHDPGIMEKLGTHFGLHPLVLEDIMNTAQRPKIEAYDDYIFIIMKIIFYDKEDNLIKSEQISIVLFKTCIITFQEGGLTVFNPVRERIRSGKGRIRKRGPDYLAYALIDAIVDNYFFVLESIGSRIEILEEELEEETKNETMVDIRNLKKENMLLRKSIWPIREVLNSLVKEETTVVDKSSVVFYRDVYDHTIQVIDTIENYREVLSGLVDLHNSNVNNRMNEVMKVLTIMGSIFIPLTFFAGIYGMNFEYIPGISWHYSYHAFWVFLIVLGGALVVFFKKKKWL